MKPFSRQLSSRFRLNPECQVNTWQLISVNINRQRSLTISVIKEKTTKSWDVSNLELLGYVCYGGESRFATLLVSEQFDQDNRILETG